jgi:transposase
MMIQGFREGSLDMSRYDLTDFEWRVIEPLLPNKPRGVPRVDDRRVLNGIFWVLRSGAPWRDLPERYGPRTTCYNRFVRWRRAGVWDRLMDAISAAYDGDIQMIDSTSIRAHQQAATAKRGVEIIVSVAPAALGLLDRLAPRTIVLGDKPVLSEVEGAYDAGAIRDLIEAQGAVPNIPAKFNRKWKPCFSKSLYRERNLVERFFSKALLSLSKGSSTSDGSQPATTSSPTDCVISK